MGVAIFFIFLLGGGVGFYLAKLQYQRGDLSSAGKALQKMQISGDDQMGQEAIYLKARLLLNAGDTAAAQQQIALLQPESPWLPYYFYNLGVVEKLNANNPGAVEAFKQLDSLAILTEEEKALRDRAYTASGFSHIAGGDLEQAKVDFSKVRIDSPLVDQALLGYGWAYAKQKNYRAALSPWQKLSQHSLLSPSVQESLLAIPFAYEAINAPANALLNYQQAVNAYESEITRINSAITLFQQEPMEQLFDLASSSNDEWLVGGEILPLNQHAPYLAHLIASHGFQEAIKDLRDLIRMSIYLRQAQQRLAILETVDSEQIELWNQVIDQSRMKSLYQRQQDISSKREKLKEQLATAVTENDGKRLADSKQMALWEKIDRAEDRINRLQSAGRDVGDDKARLEIYRGMMLWDDNENFADGLWKYKKQINALAALGDETTAAFQRVERATGSRQQSSFSARIAGLDTRVNQHSSSVNAALVQAEENIRTQAVSELQLQQQRLSYYMAQAKLAIARLYDRGSIEGMQR